MAFTENPVITPENIIRIVLQYVLPQSGFQPQIPAIVVYYNEDNTQQSTITLEELQHYIKYLQMKAIILDDGSEVIADQDGNTKTVISLGIPAEGSGFPIILQASNVSEGNPCGISPTIYFIDHNGILEVGDIIYEDSTLLIPITGSSLVATTSGEIYNVDDVTGEVLSLNEDITCPNPLLNNVSITFKTGNFNDGVLVPFDASNELTGILNTQSIIDDNIVVGYTGFFVFLKLPTRGTNIFARQDSGDTGHAIEGDYQLPSDFICKGFYSDGVSWHVQGEWLGSTAIDDCIFLQTNLVKITNNTQSTLVFVSPSPSEDIKYFVPKESIAYIAAINNVEFECYQWMNDLTVGKGYGLKKTNKLNGVLVSEELNFPYKTTIPLSILTINEHEFEDIASSLTAIITPTDITIGNLPQKLNAATSDIYKWADNDEVALIITNDDTDEQIFLDKSVISKNRDDISFTVAQAFTLGQLYNVSVIFFATGTGNGNIVQSCVVENVECVAVAPAIDLVATNATDTVPPDDIIINSITIDGNPVSGGTYPVLSGDGTNSTFAFSGIPVYIEVDVLGITGTTVRVIDGLGNFHDAPFVGAATYPFPDIPVVVGETISVVVL